MDATAPAGVDDSFKTLFYLSPVGMAISTMDTGTFLEVNDAYCAICGYTRAQLLGHTSIELKLVNVQDREQILETMGRVGFVRNLDISLFTPTGDVRFVAASIHRAKFYGQECFITTVMDITERRQLEKELEYLSQTDVLTGLANRRHFMQLAEVEWSRSTRYGGELSVLMIDIDHFKTINDSYGHHAGDLVIHQLGRLCKDTFRDIDLIGRLGGEEFAVVLPQTNAEAAQRAAERLRQGASDALIPHEGALPLRFSVSIGVATLLGGETTFEALLGHADQALYAAKRAGRNRVREYAAPAQGAGRG